MSIKSANQRNFGLDVVRSVAILSVLIRHLYFLTNNEYVYKFVNHELFTLLFMITGVNLFFVLSGFLIGKIIINLFLKENYISNIKNFYIRRWFRTLPLYYLIFTIHLFSQKINLFSDFHYKYLIFIQTFDSKFHNLNFFPVSWTLAIEEWFYLLLPLLLLIPLKQKIKPENLYVTIIKIIALITVIKFAYTIVFQNYLDLGPHSFLPFRFDALLIGVLFACLKINNKELYEKFLNTDKTFVIAGIIAIFSIFIFREHYNPTLNLFLVNIVFSIFISIVGVIIIIFFERNEFINKVLPKNLIVKHFFEKTSCYSYAIYLSHLPIYVFYSLILTSPDSLFMQILLCITTTYLISAGLYRYYEKPLMDIRDKF